MIKNESLIIDCQILQTAAFDRGMGKYTSSLIKALSSRKEFANRYNQIFLLVNSNLNLPEERKIFISSLVPNSKILSLGLPKDIDTDNLQKLKQARKIVSEACEEICSNSTTSFLVTAPFFVGFPSVFPKQKEIIKYSIVYDFIPYRIWNKQKIFPDEIYFQHFKLFLDANHLFTISEFVKSDLINLFGFSESKITSIDGGPFEQTIPKNIKDRPIEEEYIIYPSAPIIHKNNIKAVQGFERFNKSKNNKFKLIITSTFDEETKRVLSRYSKNVIFTGNISDQELYRYYHHASSLMFASLSEGLGMPVLEAIMHGIPVACSDIPVLTEISREALYLFDPTSTASIANSLTAAIDKHDFAQKQKTYSKINNKYTWERSASILDKFSSNKKTVEVNKKSLLIISDLSNNDSKQARFIEHTFSQFYDKFNTSIHFNRKNSSKHKLPSYVANLDTGNITDDFDFELIISKRKLFNRKEGILNACIISKKSIIASKKAVVIRALRYKVDNALNFKDWQYSLDGKTESTSEQIVNEISKQLNQ